MLRRQQGVAGVSPWILKDFRSPLRLYQGVQDYWNRKGLIADDGAKKQAFGVLRDWYLEQASGSREEPAAVPSRS
jgi:beta-glucuronidase